MSTHMWRVLPLTIKIGAYVYPYARDNQGGTIAMDVTYRSQGVVNQHAFLLLFEYPALIKKSLQLGVLLFGKQSSRLHFNCHKKCE